METTSLLKKEVIAPRLAGSTNMLLIYGQSFFQFGKWSKMGSNFLVRKVVRVDIMVAAGGINLYM
jgi:hypothetical protein